MSTTKENMPPVSNKKSKLPLPIMNIVSSIKRGRKRAISPSASSSDAKRSPICTRASDKSRKKPGCGKYTESKRQVFGELPQEQRKIVKVRRALDGGKDDVKNVFSKASTSCKKMKGNSKKETSRKQTKFASNTKQSDIVFEKDDSALQSILDETGIQYGQRQTAPNFTRHTLAAVPKPQRVSKDYSTQKKVCVEELCQVFDDFISRNARKEPPAKRQCRETESCTNGERFNLKLTPSKTDFCAKYGVDRSTTFTGATPKYCARQSLPGRTKGRPLDPFVLPSRTSMMSQTPRLTKVDENPGRVSLTPMRVPRHEMNFTSDENQVGVQSSTGRVGIGPIIPGRFSLAARSSTRPGSALQAPGRVSLVEGKNTQQYTAPTPGRVSFSAQRTLPQNFDDFEEGKPKRLSFVACTPGRVSVPATRPNPNTVPSRQSLIDHTPGRVKRENLDDQFSVKGSGAANVRMNLQSAFSMETHGNTMKSELTGENPDTSDDKVVAVKSWHDILLSESNAKTIASASSTPQRVKASQNEVSKDTTTTPKRTLAQSITTTMTTPMRVLKTTSKTDCSTPPVRELRQAPVMKTPVRVLLSKEKQSHLSTPPQRIIVPVSTITPKRVPVPFSTRTPKSAMTLNIEAESPALSGRKTPSPSGEGKPYRDCDSKKQVDCIDLRTIWKTKKTPSKSPIMKEVLSEETNEDVSSTPQMTSLDSPCAVLTSVRRKKTITWAEEVKSTSLGDVGIIETDDEFKRHEQNIAQPSCDAMQDNPDYEECTATPAEISHNATVTRSPSTCDNMQLPVCVAGSSVQQSENTTSSLELGTSPKDDDPCLKVHESIVSHPSNFVQLASDSLLVSQAELGQHHGNVLANTMRDEFLQKQIQLYQEKKRQLAQLQKQINQHLLKGSHSELERFEYGLERNRELDNAAPTPVSPCEATEIASENVELTDIENSFKKLDNQKLDDDLVMCSLECKNGNFSQGFLASNEVNLDMNSNITVSNTVNANVQLQSDNIYSASSSASETPTPNQHPTCSAIQNNEEENVNPFIVKTKQFIKTPDSCTDNRILGSDRNSQYLRENLDKACQPTETNAPIWTPLAMKSVAKRQNTACLKDKPNTIIPDANSECCDSMTNFAEAKIYNNAKTVDNDGVISTDNTPSCGLALDEELNDSTEVRTTYHNYPQTPPNRKSAFQSLGNSGLTPVVGSLSLRANSATKRDKTTSKSDALHDCVLKIANERYLEALLDDEVELFMCRLSPGVRFCKGREYCYDPVSVTLMYGDEMHFIPVESCVPAVSSHINGSAFSKFTVRAT